jgi:uncharacterized membrane protein
MSSTKSYQGTEVGLLVLAFTQETAGDEALKAMEGAKLQHRFYFENAAVIRQDVNGKVHYRETGDARPGEGAGVGALIGGTIGILGGPAGIALGASAGAALGALIAHYDDGFNNQSLNTVGVALQPGMSAVVAITSDVFLESLQKQVSLEKIQLFVNNLAAKISTRLNEGKNVALSIFLAEEGVVFKEVVVGGNSAEVIELLVTKKEAVVQSGMVTSQGAFSVGDPASGGNETPER